MRKSTFDIQLFIAFLIVMVVGVAFVYSASYPSALATSNDDLKILNRQLMAIGFGAILMLAARFVPLLWLRKGAQWIMLGGFLVLGGVLAWGNSIGGNKAWLLGGQPSEFVKILLINVMAACITAHPVSIRGDVNFFSWITKPFGYLGITMLLIAFQKDLGTMIIIALTGGVLLVLSGMKFRHLAKPLAFVAALVLFAIVLSPAVVHKYAGQRGDRIIAWLHPFDNKMPPEVKTAAYQPENSLVAIGSGQLFGVGFCQSRQKWLYLPEPQNDYIFSIMSEELGFLFIIPLFFLPYLWMLFRGYFIAKNSPDEFSATLAFGIVILLATQATVNIAVAMNLLPCMGVTLPLISSGGSSIMSSMIMIGLLLNISSPYTFDFTWFERFKWFRKRKRVIT
ncbi:MAG: FtsW/RodA/SpoVE family cell cycle protein [bacterium]